MPCHAPPRVGHAGAAAADGRVTVDTRQNSPDRSSCGRPLHGTGAAPYGAAHRARPRDSARVRRTMEGIVVAAAEGPGQRASAESGGRRPACLYLAGVWLAYAVPADGLHTGESVH